MISLNANILKISTDFSNIISFKNLIQIITSDFKLPNDAFILFAVKTFLILNNSLWAGWLKIDPQIYLI